MNKNYEYIRKYSDKVLFKKLFKYIKPVMNKFITAIVLVFIIVLLDMVPSLVIGLCVNVCSDSSYVETYSFFGSTALQIVLVICALLVLSVFISCIINYCYSMILQRLGQDMVFEVRKDTFEHIEELTIGQINSQPIGKLVTRVTNDTNALSNLFTSVLVLLIRYMLTMIVIYVILWCISWKLTVYITIVIPVIILATMLFRLYSRKAYREVRASISIMNSYLSENISGMKITQIFNQEEKKYLEFQNHNDELRKANLKQTFVFSIFRPLIYVLFIICIIITLYIGSQEVAVSYISIGILISYYSYIGNFFQPVQNIAEQFNALQEALASCEKIFTNLDTKVAIVDSKEALDYGILNGKIEFKHVWFAYNDDNWILKDVSFTINPKETCAFVGATGAGKSTILGLICRNYEFQKGEILLDGIDIRKIKISSLRRNIGQMLQDVFLFSGTIKDNITIYDDSYSDKEIMDATKYVNADTIIDKFENGLYHRVEERGANFSQGERQLLSFARTVLAKPNIMILDEATANIDTETETIIQDSLSKMMNIGTMLIVAHRLSTIQHADKIIVLNHGEVIEEGNHQQLLAKKGMYYALYKLQYKNMEKEK